MQGLRSSLQFRVHSKGSGRGVGIGGSCLGFPKILGGGGGGVFGSLL